MSQNETDKLQKLFQSVTGDTMVVEKQETERSDREIVDTTEAGPSDTIDHHGFADVIDDAEPTGEEM